MEPSEMQPSSAGYQEVQLCEKCDTMEDIQKRKRKLGKKRYRRVLLVYMSLGNVFM